MIASKTREVSISSPGQDAAWVSIRINMALSWDGRRCCVMVRGMTISYALASLRLPLMAAIPACKSSSPSFCAPFPEISPSLPVPLFSDFTFSCTSASASASLMLPRSLSVLSVGAVEPSLGRDDSARGSTISHAAAPFLRSMYAWNNADACVGYRRHNGATAG